MLGKRIFDILFSALVCIFVLSWLTPLIAIIIFLESRENLFFTQKRIGKFGKPFIIYKFKSMKGVPPVNDPLLSNDEKNRITKFGKFMRTYRIDEFPQFVNVLLGEMSIVGPRPERQQFLDKVIAQIPKYELMQQLKPGITSIGQIKYGYADSISQMLNRARYDLIYLENFNYRTDLKVIFATIKVVFKGTGK